MCFSENLSISKDVYDTYEQHIDMAARQNNIRTPESHFCEVAGYISLVGKDFLPILLPGGSPQDPESKPLRKEAWNSAKPNSMPKRT